MGKVQKPSNAECHRPSSKPFRIYSSSLLVEENLQTSIHAQALQKTMTVQILSVSKTICGSMKIENPSHKRRRNAFTRGSEAMKVVSL
jgi:hypothetical protein